MKSAKEADYFNSDSSVIYTKWEINPTGALISETKRTWEMKSLKKVLQ